MYEIYELLDAVGHLITGHLGYSCGSRQLGRIRRIRQTLRTVLETVSFFGKAFGAIAMRTKSRYLLSLLIATRTQTAIAEKIITGRGDYVLAVKENQLGLYQEIADYWMDGWRRNRSGKAFALSEWYVKRLKSMERRKWKPVIISPVRKPIQVVRPLCAKPSDNRKSALAFGYEFWRRCQSNAKQDRSLES